MTAERVPPDSLVRRLLELRDEGERQRLLFASLEGDAIDDLLASLRVEAERQLTIDPHAASRLATAVIDGAERVGRPGQRALGLLLRADALRFLGAIDESIGVYEEARRVFAEQRDEVGWARTFSGWAWSTHYVGRGEEALAAALPAYDILARHQEWLRAAALDQNLWNVCYELGRYDQALQLCDRALRTYEALGEAVANRAARAKANKALILAQMGDFRAALALHEEARIVMLRHGDTLAALKEEYFIALVHVGLGRYTHALRLCGDAFVVLDQAGLQSEAAWAALAVAECSLRLNRTAEALDMARDAAARFERCGTPTEVAKARLACAEAYARLGASDQALNALGEAAEIFGRTGLAGQVASATLQRASLHLDRLNWPSALAEAERASALFGERGLVIRQAQADLVRARALLGLDRHDEAARLAHAALATTEARDVHWLAHDGHHILANAARARGDLDGALAAYGAAIASVEGVQSRLAIQLRSGFLADKLEVYHDAIDFCLRLGQAAQAFEYLERAKSRALVDYLIGNPEVRLRALGDAAPALGEELARARAEHNWFYAQLYGDRLARRPALAPAEAEALQATIRDRERLIARLLDRLLLHQAAGRDELGLVPVGQPLPRPRLDERTVLLEYYLRSDGGAVFVLTNTGVTVVPLAVTPGGIRRLLDVWRLNLDASIRAVTSGETLAGLNRHAQTVLEALYRALLQPVASYLAGRERVIIIPSGLTHEVPFQALHDGHRYLLETVEVTTCPSSSLVRLCADRPRRPGRSALIVAHSNDGRLPHVLEEARAVAALLPGESYLEAQATRAAVESAAARHGVLHLAAHGEARLDNPTFAHVRLADGQFSAIDVFNLPLDGALVTLSACETGRGVVLGGDEVIGLSRGFLYAGATTLVQSLWRVEDASTARLMGRFYRALRDGQSASAALRAAQLALLAEPASHPCFWAPFQLVGAGGPL